jgi:putative ubiquitin-RnfH superfamily antitoxin RatB of RatAB toxin-antitoxin module/DNA polymerase III delta prime subunit
MPSAHPFSELCGVLPTPIAFVLDEFFREVNAFVALWRMVDAAEIITRFFTITVLSDILRQKGEFPEPVQDALTDKLERPTFGAWKELLAIAIDNLPKERGQTRCFVSELPSFVRDKWLPALGSGEDKPEEKLIALRNLIAHAGRLPDEKAQELLNAHRQRFESLAKELSFLANYDLIACTKERQIVWLKGLPDADGSFPNDRPFLSFVPEHGRVYLVKEGEGLDLFPLHAFTDILQWREERYDFERLGEVAPQIYFRLSERGYLECIPFSNRAVFSYLGEDAYRCFREIFQLEEWRKQRRLEDEAKGIQKLWDEQVRELTEVFVGREEHIRQVKDAIKRTSKGVLWISGKPGVGKSALMAKLMKDYIGQTQHYIVIPYFFRYGQAGCSTMEFLETALKRLQAELNREIEPEPRLPDRQQQLAKALEEAVSETGKKVLFLVDGLDEIYRQEREFLNVPFMTMTVKDRILWVCAGRSEGDLEEALKSRGAVWVFPDGLPPLDEQAIRAMLIEHLGRLKYALFERDEGERNRFVEAVTRKSEGLPLYVRMVIEDLKAGRLTVWDEEKLPEGLVAYYERLLERLRVSDVGAVLTPLFCILAWAKEPITEGTMKVLLQTHHLAGTPRWSELFQRALEHGHLMLQQRPTPDGETGWTIYHDSFRRHLLESETVSVSREWAQERWLEVCEDWKALASQEPSLHRYILRHYAEHLYDKWQMTNEQMTYDALCRLALDSDFKQAQTEHLPDEPNLPLKTVQLALDAAIQLEDAPMMARLLIEHAKRAQSEETPLQAWRKGYQKGALRTATENIFERDHKLGTLWSLLLAWVAESEGEREWAKRFLDEIRKRWEKAKAKLTKLEYWQGEMAAFLLGEIEQLEGAIEVAGLVLDDKSKEELATGWASKRLFDQALKVAEGIEDAEKRARALSAIAVETAKVGMFEQALKVAEEIKEVDNRVEVLVVIVEEMLGLEMFEQSLKIVERIEDTRYVEKLLEKIVKEMIKTKAQEKTLWQQILKVVEKVVLEQNCIEILETILKEITEIKIINQILKISKKIRWKDKQAKTLGKIAGKMAKTGIEKQAKAVFAKALKVAEEIRWKRGRAEALGAIAEELMKVGMEKQAKEVFEKALRAAEGIEGAWERSSALRKIAGGMVRAGMVERAKAVFNQALKVAEEIKGVGQWARASAEIAVEMAKAGMFEQALKVAEGIKDVRDRAKALRAIVEEIKKAGVQEEILWQQTLEVVEGIARSGERSEALRAIAVEMAKTGMFGQALRVTEEIEEARLRSLVLREIAVEMVKAGMEERAKEVFDQALKVTEGIEEAWQRAEALREIAVEMAKAGMFDRALKVAEGIARSGERSEALRAIAVEMARVRVQEKTLWQQALKLAEEVEDAWWQVEALREIAEGMARAGMFEQALELVEKIKDAEKRAETLKTISREMAKAKIQEETLWRQVLKVAEEIKKAWEQVEALKAIAEGMVRVGMEERAKEVFDQALKVAEGIKGAWWQKLASAIEKIEEGVRKFDWEEMKKIERVEERAWALREIVEGLAMIGGFEQEALKIAKEIEKQEEQTRALKVIEEMMMARKVEGAVSIWEQETEIRTGILPPILWALAERASEGDEKSKEGFLRLLPLCRWSPELAYYACVLLFWLYPERREEIARVLRDEWRERQRIASGEWRNGSDWQNGSE